MEKVWLKSYPKGVPEFAKLDQYNSLAHMFDECAERHSHLPAFANMGATISFSELNIESYNFAAYLQSELGCNKGDRVAIMLPNLLQFPVALYGVLRSGCVAVDVNPLYTSRELGHYLKDSGAKVIVILENFADVLAEVIHDTDVEHVILARVGDMLGFPKSLIVNFVLKYIQKKIPKYSINKVIPFNEALAVGQQRQLTKPELTRDDLAFLQFTGGTTGLAKGAMLSHGNLLANVAQAGTFFGPILEESTETVITALPLYHIFSLTANCFLFTKIGGLNYLITNPRDMKGFVIELSKIKFSVITGVTEWHETTGCVLAEAYGLTEASPAVTMNPYDIEKYNGTIGLPIPNTEISIQDDEGNHLGVEEAGELCVRGPQVMQGYWNRPEETKNTISEDGWLKTGDIAMVSEEGFVRIVDRKKDMILVSGFNVYPNEIENVVQSHAGVLEVAAVGVDDEESGEVVKLFIVKKDPALTEEDVMEYCKDRLTRYKWPKHIEFRNDLPKTNVGKILRRALRDGE